MCSSSPWSLPLRELAPDWPAKAAEPWVAIISPGLLGLPALLILLLQLNITDYKMDSEFVSFLPPSDEDKAAERRAYLQNTREEYNTLDDQLKSLPERLTHEILIPIGKIGFIPGNIVHSNELLVYLGENTFIEQTASQARGIVSRRLENIDK